VVVGVTNDSALLSTPAVSERHLLNRFSFGCTQDLAAEAAAAGGAHAWFEAQLMPASVPDPFGDAMQDWWPHLSMTPGQLQAADDAGTLDSGEVPQDLIRWSLMRRAYSKRQLFETMVSFWLDHLRVTVSTFGTWAVRIEHDTAVRKRALGRFDDMLPEVVLGRAMGCYLDNFKSTARRLNENLGRELLELHTVGREAGYTESDVLDAARVLTGYRVDLAGTWDLVRAERPLGRPGARARLQPPQLGARRPARGGGAAALPGPPPGNRPADRAQAVPPVRFRRARRCHRRRRRPGLP